MCLLNKMSFFLLQLFIARTPRTLFRLTSNNVLLVLYDADSCQEFKITVMDQSLFLQNCV